MPRPLPTLRRKKTAAVVTLTDSVSHQRRDFHCGPWGSAQARQKYAEYIGQWEMAGRRWPYAARGEGMTIVELVQQYKRWSDTYYGVGERGAIGTAGGVMVDHCGDLPAIEFGPLKLREVQHCMVAKGWNRKSINKQVHRACAVFKWASSNELLPITVYQALKTVPPLKRGRTTAAEPDPVQPVSLAHVEAIKSLVSRQVWAIIELQRLSGARPGELLRIKPADIDRSAKIWRMTLAYHKTEHRGTTRIIHFGPLAQDVLLPWLMRPEAEFCFSPAEANAERLRTANENRKRPMKYEYREKRERKNVGGCYTTASYRRAIARACKTAGIPEWHPHQLRHTAATEIRRQFGLEAAQVVLGHSSAMVTDAVYAARDQAKVDEVMLKIG